MNAEEWDEIEGMLASNAAHFGTKDALCGERGVRLSHADLQSRVAETAHSLRASGIRRGDRVAIVLPLGVDLGVAFLSVAVEATAAPLNPSYLEHEMAFYLQDLSAKALIVVRGVDTPARAAATKLGIPVLEWIPLHEGGGIAAHEGSQSTSQASPDATRPDNVALVLHTSGTTSRPKRVPLSHANLCASARNIAANLHLTPDDVGLSTMPLFHIHGLACLLAALGSGGSCVCVGPLQAEHFSRWVSEWGPTWLSAVPTSLQVLLELARGKSVDRGALRFIRSSSSALPPAVMLGLEETLGIPVVESYGMTEAAHQMASNPLPPRNRKPGSVGLPAGPQMTTLGPSGEELEKGTTGEIAIRGPNVTRGYENNPEANASAFINGWFRTGDQGYFDEDGFLHITGRLKELINRGGEKIAPREIDDALLAHPDIAQAVAFAVPHQTLVEDVAAAVVLRAGINFSETALRTFLLERLPAFKMPSRVIVVDQLPKGPTGKIQRIGMADRLASSMAIAFEAPSTEMEKLVAEAMAACLDRGEIGRLDNFFMMGGDSLRATQVLARLDQKLNLALPATLLFRLPSPSLLGARLEGLAAERELDLLAADLSALPAEEQEKLLADIPPSSSAGSQSDCGNRE